MSTSYQSTRPIVVDSELPAQSEATNGKALISNGITASWNTVLGMVGTNPGQVPPHQLLNTILPDQSGNNGMVLTTDGANASWSTGGSSTTGYTVTLAATSTYTLSESDAGTVIGLTDAFPITVVVPATITTVGTSIDIIQSSTSQITVTGEPGVTINSAVGTKTRAQYSRITLLCVSPQTWIVSGDATN
jgi:hypothetical protein